MVFEAGHEFGHIWFDPRIRDSWFVESVCMAFSHIALEEMAKEWSSYGRQPFVDYAPKFAKVIVRPLSPAIGRNSGSSQKQISGRGSRETGLESTDRLRAMLPPKNLDRSRAFVRS